MNRKRNYLCLLAKLIAEKIIKNHDDRLINEVSVKIIKNHMTIRITYSNSDTHDNFSVALYEFQSFKNLSKARKEVFKYLDDAEKTLDRIKGNL